MSAFKACHENCDDCEKMTEFQFDNPSTDKKLSSNALMEEVKPILLEKREFQYRDLSNLKTFCAIFRPSKLRRKLQDPSFSIEKSSSCRQVLLEHSMTNFKLVVVEKFEFENLGVVIRNISGLYNMYRIGIKEKA